MRYKIELSKKAKKQLGKLDKDDQDRVISVLQRVRFRPRRYAQQLSTNKYFRLRAGHFRMIIDIKDAVMIILVIEIDKCDKIYK